MIKEDVSNQRQNQQHRLYAFDLKLNVDFDSGHLTVNVPPNVPFAKKVSAPPPYSAHYYPTQSQPAPQYIPIKRQGSNTNLNIPVFKSQIMHASHQETISDQSINPQQKRAQSLNTTTFRLQQSPSGVQCVICQKVINQDAFSLHLEQHKNRRKNKQRSSLQESDLSIRNQNEYGEIAQLVNPPPSFSFIPHSLSFSRSNDHSRPQVAPNQSNTIFFPVMAENPSTIYHNEIHSSKSQMLNNMSNSSQSFFFNNTSLQQHQVVSPPSFSNSNQRSYLSNQVSNSNQMSNPSYHQAFIPHNINQPMSPPQRDIHNLPFNRIQSRIIRQQINRQNTLEQCGQSRISSRNSLPTKYSQLHQMEKQLHSRQSINQQQESSSDDQSLKVYGYKSHRSLNQPKKERSNMSQKLSKTKLPINYLARQEFITSSTHSTMAYKSKGTN